MSNELDQENGFKYVEYQRKKLISFLFFIFSISLTTWFNLVVTIKLVDSSLIFFFIQFIQALVIYIVINSKYFFIKMERPVLEISEGEYGNTIRLGELRPFQDENEPLILDGDENENTS